MTPHEKRREIMALMVALAEFYRIQVQRHQVEMYAKALEDLSLDQLAYAIDAVQKSSKFFPMPAELREIALGSAKDEALEAANRIVEALHRFGWTNPDKAKEYVGELAWRVVEREGGWKNICKVESDDLGILKAQWRELAAATLRRGASGHDSIAPKLSTLRKQGELTPISSMLAIASKVGGAQ